MKNKETAYFAGGCFWGVQYHFQNLSGVLSTRVGYMGGTTENPTYAEVCKHHTGHAETLEVVFDPEIVTFEELAKLFFEIHDPTEFNRQGPDIGDQYRSAIFYTEETQKEIAQKLIAQLQAKGLRVVTKLEAAKKFYVAEEYHQHYYEKNRHEPYCHVRVKRF